MAKGVPSTALTAGALARAAGVSTDTLRHYERKGLIAPPPRAANGYRHYPAETLPRVELIRQALTIGFTLDELSRVLRSRDRGEVPCAQVRALAAQKLTELDQRLSELVALRDSLRATVAEWDLRLTRTPAGQRAGLLEALTARDAKGGKRSAAFSTNAKRKERRR